MARKKHNYSGKIKTETAERIYKYVMEELTRNKRYLDSDLTAAQLVKELKTNPRSFSMVMKCHMHGSFNTVVNRLRIQRAIHMLKIKKYKDITCEEIGLMCGFASRQSYYNAFKRELGITPAAYRSLKCNKKENK